MIKEDSISIPWRQPGVSFRRQGDICSSDTTLLAGWESRLKPCDVPVLRLAALELVHVGVCVSVQALEERLVQRLLKLLLWILLIV